MSIAFYEFGNDGDIYYVDNVKSTYVSKCLMAMSHAESRNFFLMLMMILLMLVMHVMFIGKPFMNLNHLKTIKVYNNKS